MKSLHWASINFPKNAKRRGKQNHLCLDCRYQFIDVYSPGHKYPDNLKRQCLEMYFNGMGFRAIKRVIKVNNVTTMNRVKQEKAKINDIINI